MKYYYGNSYKEAVSNKPVEIKTTKQLRGYEENYTFLIPAENVLPDRVEVEIDSCLADNINDDEWMEQYLNDYLSDKYGYCIEGYNWEVENDKIIITDIYWDTSY